MVKFVFRHRSTTTLRYSAPVLEFGRELEFATFEALRRMELRRIEFAAAAAAALPQTTTDAAPRVANRGNAPDLVDYYVPSDRTYSPAPSRCATPNINDVDDEDVIMCDEKNEETIVVSSDEEDMDDDAIVISSDEEEDSTTTTTPPINVININTYTTITNNYSDKYREGERGGRKRCRSPLLRNRNVRRRLTYDDRPTTTSNDVVIVNSQEDAAVVDKIQTVGESINKCVPEHLLDKIVINNNHLKTLVNDYHP
ncbi:asb006 [Agrotis segetum nucleopolyhedrovirus B]|uniref:Asb006 n=3 Tax=Alphabaculovirus TaxID=558016 RepID=A0A0A7KR00_9ABAC|nr:asb006 [Agrotis segetum nucleopolyhedrovirus B]AIZ48564.1 asb006 [Agrotis segetum nucleopolyhedrovirus B]